MKALRFMQCIFHIVVLVAPIMIIGSILIGLGFYVLNDDRETALWICSIGLLVSLLLAPIAAKIFSKRGGDTESFNLRAINHTGPQSASMNTSSKNQRQHIRYPLVCAATFSNEQKTGFGMLADISRKGCRFKTKVPMSPHDSGKLLIDVPSSTTPLRIATAVVRWVAGSECGIEFMTIGAPEQSFLERTVDMIINARMARVKEVSAILRMTIPILKNN
ncbi:MAG TPA: PilZ domain-containing protein [Nitrospira sp.]|nr:PilZ domain-containing protein [Nitrospira sp.]